jgi:hypothetical protein
MTGGGSACWIWAFGLFYWATQTSISSFSGIALYLGYLFLLALLDFLVMGAYINSGTKHMTDVHLTHQGLLVSLHRIGWCGSSIVLFVSTDYLESILCILTAL